MTDFFDEKSYYLEKLKNEPLTKFWRNPSGALKRYDAAISCVDLTGSSILDVGCGIGDFLGHLNRRDVAIGSYTGLDIVPEFIDQARGTHTNGNFILGDISEPDILLPAIDWAIAIGIFGHVQPNNRWLDRFRTVTNAMWFASQKGIIFTLTSNQSPTRNLEAYYADAVEIFSEVKGRLGPRIVIDHRYLPNDFLIGVMKNEK